MKGLRKRGARWYVWVNIPDYARHLFTAPQIRQSLETGDEAEAVVIGGPILADIWKKIAQAKADHRQGRAVIPTVVAKVAAPARAYTPEEISRALDRWTTKAIAESRRDHFNGTAPAYGALSAEAVAHGKLLTALKSQSPATIPGFAEKLAEALASEGVMIATGSPILNQPLVIQWFAAAWHDVETADNRFRKGQFDYAPASTDKAPVRLIQPATAVKAAPGAVTSLDALLERYLSSEARKGEDDLRSQLKRLVSFLGSKADNVATLTSDDFDQFKIALRKYPTTRRPDIVDVPFLETLKLIEGKEFPTVSETTVWKHFVSYKSLFKFAQGLKMISDNPVTAVMPKKPKPARKIKFYEADQIRAMFSKPLFQGFTGSADRGYRDKTGDTIVRDAKYWLPIFALYHGCRLEEVGAAKVANFKKYGDIRYLDLTERSVKNDNSKRMIPLHPDMERLGFLKHLESLPADGYLFPELPHDPEDEDASTRQYSKWFGHWCEKEGFKDPEQNFHSFRHTFKRAIRGLVGEDISDLITGHKGLNVTSRGYGPGAELQIMADAIKLASYPTFPNLRA